MLSTHIQTLLNNLKKDSKKAFNAYESDTLIHVNNITSKVGAFYEKVRYFVDYKDDHTIRRSAIERILKRKIRFESGTATSLPLIQELIRGGYLSNDSIPESVAKDIQKIIDIFVQVREILKDAHVSSAVHEKLISILGSSIDSFFYPQFIEDSVTQAMYEISVQKIRVEKITDEERVRKQIYIACRRSLLKNDDETLLYALWLRYSGIASLSELPSAEIIAGQFVVVCNTISCDVKDHLGWQLTAKLRNYALYFSLVRDVINKYGVESESVLGDPAYLDKTVTDILQHAYKNEYGRIYKSSTRAIVYIFCTKIILALAVELPYEYFLLHSTSYVPLAINILFHPLLLLTMTRSIRPLGASNTSLAIAGLHSVLYDAGDTKVIKVKPKGSYGFIGTVFALVYLAVFGVTLSVILSVLNALKFNWVSICLFLLFLSLVSYFGLRIRHTAQRLKIHTGNESSFAVLWNIFTLPIINLGQWMTRSFSTINIFVFTMDFLIEAPFKFILGFSDSFISYIKDKKDETF
ncbi:MAG: hypothetical protein WC757_04485 [Candidatus Paceibacterota bacterium]|jgi:hypothetical protein